LGVLVQRPSKETTRRFEFEGAMRELEFERATKGDTKGQMMRGP